jgi:hypothetical protein
MIEDDGVMEARMDAAWEIANALLVEIRKGCQRHGKDPYLHIVIASAVGKLIDGLAEINPKIPLAVIAHLQITSGEGN